MEARDRRKNNKISLKKDSRGLSLVEVICAVAIFSLVAAVMGGILVISSRSYRNGSTETVVQQEAQFAANRIGGIIQDAVKAEFVGDEAGNYGRLVLNSGTKKYVVELVEGSNELKYGEAETDVADASITADALLAENIVSFHADTTKFATSKTVRLDMIVEADGRQYVMSYNMTARNDEVTLDEVPAVHTAAIVTEGRIILEPGQEYTIPVTVIGSDDGLKVTSVVDASQAEVSCTGNDVKVSMKNSAGISANEFYINIATNENDDDGNSLATASILVQIRRVDGMELTVTHQSGEEGKTGASYKISSNLTQRTPYLAKKIGASWDTDYKNPYAVKWDKHFTIGGAASNFEQYFKVVETKEDVDNPYMIVELKKDLVVGAKLTVEGISKHAAIDGGNKSGTAYNTAVKASAEIIGPSLSGEENLIMEPGDSYSTPLPVASCSITATPSVSALQSKGTTLTFADGTFTLKIGKKETGDSDGKIKIELRPAGDADLNNVMTIYVAIRRVDDITLQCKQLTGAGHKVKEPLLKEADYQFATKIEGTNLIKSAEEMEEDYLPNPYAVEFSWEFMIAGKKITGLEGISGSVIWDEYNYIEKTGKETMEYDNPATNPGNKYFKLVDLGTNSEHPCINFSLNQDFPANAELIVTAKALHPAGKDSDGVKRNHNGVAYVEGDVIATAVLEGEKTVGIETAKDTIIVEPNEGAQEKGDEHELAIPVYVTGTISGLEAEITGNSDKNTKLVSFEEGTNPEKDASNPKVWWVWLAIGKNETGNNDTGKMTLKLTAYGYDGDDKKITLDEIEPTLALRRVTDVNVDAGEINNMASGTITLSADVQGYGKDGTEYFAQQKQTTTEEYAPRWDANNYVTPYAWEWTIKENGTSKKLENSSYIDSTSIQYTTKENKQTVTFKLTKQLPIGTVVRATSLHASGENKSGKQYEDVYGEYELGKIIDLDDPFDDREIDFLDNILRGQDFDKFPDAHETQNLPGDFYNRGKWFMRTREILGKDEKGNLLYGPWTAYRRMKENSPYKKLNAEETRSFLPDKRYQLQMAFMVIDPDKQMVYWPYDTSLTEQGSGTGFEGYSIDWDTSTQQTAEEVYSSIYNIGRACIGFEENGINYKCYGSLDNPYVLNPGGSFQINLTGYTIEYGHYQQKCHARVQKLVNNEWVEIPEQNWAMSIQDQSQFLLIKEIQSSAVGTYRISIKVVDNEGADWTQWNGDIWNPVYERFYNTEFLLCGSNGTAGYLYIRIE